MNRESLERDGWPCPTGAEMRAIDRDAIERRGLPGRVLMETAGRAVARSLLERWPWVRRPLIVCGRGNNGGDGYVVARVLAEWSSAIAPRVVRVAEGSPPDDAKACLDLLQEAPLVLDPEALERLAAEADLIVDALFGVGLTRPVEGALARLLHVLDQAPAPRIAIDLPSGCSSETGRPLGAALRCDRVVTLGLPKLGLALLAEAPEIRVVDIGLPQASIDAAQVRQHLWTRATAARHLPARPASGHKGTFGHLLVIAGSEGKTGAAVLAAEAALRSGAGLVTVAVPATLHDVLETKLTEAMTLPAASDGPGFAASASERLLDEAGARDGVVLGPGLGRTSGASRVAEHLVARYRGPLVVDADGLAPFAGRPEELGGSGERVLTPHPGELGRLLGTSSEAIQADRLAAVRDAARRSGCVVLLKGARSLVAEPGGAVRINPTGGPALATGGSGDVLAGLVGTLLMQGLGAFDAATLGAFVHGAAGDDLPGVGATAGDLARALPAAYAALEGTRESIDEERPFP